MKYILICIISLIFIMLSGCAERGSELQSTAEPREAETEVIDNVLAPTKPPEVLLYEPTVSNLPTEEPYQTIEPTTMPETTKYNPKETVPVLLDGLLTETVGIMPVEIAAKFTIVAGYNGIMIGKLYNHSFYSLLYIRSGISGIGIDDATVPLPEKQTEISQKDKYISAVDMIIINVKENLRDSHIEGYITFDSDTLINNSIDTIRIQGYKNDEVNNKDIFAFLFYITFQDNLYKLHSMYDSISFIPVNQLPNDLISLCIDMPEDPINTMIPLENVFIGFFHVLSEPSDEVEIELMAYSKLK